MKINKGLLIAVIASMIFLFGCAAVSDYRMRAKINRALQYNASSDILSR